MDQIVEVHPKPDEAKHMPYAPAIYVPPGTHMYFISGATASPLYHQHPHVAEEHILPDDIREQTRLCMENIKLILDKEGLEWRNVVKVTKYLTDMRECDDMHAVMNEYMAGWKPASTMVAINNLSSPGARIELDMIAIKTD
jgi:2-iminobutanoate/2-iminopropanoate deaminase/2-aminomuconate deaminase